MPETTPIPHPSVFTRTLKVEWADVCATGHLSLTGLFDIVQTTAAAHADLCRFGFRQMSAAGQAWVLNRMLVRFSGLPAAGQEVSATTWIHATSGIVSQRNLLIESEGRTIARVSTCWMCIDLSRRTPARIAVDYPSYLVLPEKDTGLPPAGKIRLPDSVQTLRDYRVAFSDIDALGHVNNVKYTQWILDSIPYQRALEVDSGEVEVNFLSELRPGTEVAIQHGISPAGDVFVVRRKADGTPAFVSRFTSL